LALLSNGLGSLMADRGPVVRMADRGPVVRMADLGPAAGVAAKRPVACGVVSGGNRTELERRVVRAAEAALAERKFVTAIDVLVGVGWLQPAKVPSGGRAGWTIWSGR
jgi:hypothetical protein